MNYITKPGQISGTIRIPRGWHGVGQSVRFQHTLYSPTQFSQKGPFVPPMDIMKSGTIFAATIKLFKELRYLSHRVNEVIRCVDPDFYENCLKLRERFRRLPFLQALSSIDPLVVEGREALFNRESPEHTDSSDPPWSLAVLVALGNFRGGDVNMKQLGLTVRMEPGDVVVLRGRVIKHGILAWVGGQRICIPHFTHTSLWKLLNLWGLVCI
jgi:hypothetical protein